MHLLRLIPRFRRAERRFPALRARECWSRDEIEAFQLERLNAIWGHAQQHVPYYRKLAAVRNCPCQFEDLDQFREFVPIVPRAAIRDAPEQFISQRCLPGHWRSTSGSTGIPTRVYWSHQAHQEVLLARYSFYDSWNVGVFDRVAFLWGHLSPPRCGLAGSVERATQHGRNWLRNRIHLSAHNLGRPALRRYLRQLEAFRPAAIYAFSGAAQLLALEAASQGWSCDSLRAVFLTGEPVYPQVVRTVERVFQVPAVVEYGSTECGFLAGQDHDGRLRVREDLAIVDTPARPDGRYDIVVSVLTNGCFPLLRYAIGDATDTAIDQSADGFATLASVSGRNNDVIRTVSGSWLHPGQLASLFESDRAVRRFRVHQDASGAIAAMVEVQGDYGELLALDLQRRLQGLMEGYPVRIEIVSHIPPGPNGKHRFISSDMAAEFQQPPEAEPLSAVTTKVRRAAGTS